MFSSIGNTSKNYEFNTWDKEKLGEIINNYDKEMLTILSDLYASLTGERLDLNNIANTVDMLMKYNAKSEYNYLNNLLYPEKCKSVKIPSPIPIPSCSFQLHNCVTLQPNGMGNIAILFNPNFLASKSFVTSPDHYTTDKKIYFSGTGTTYDETSTLVPKAGELLYSPSMLSSLLVNNDAGLTGTQPNNNFRPININQCIPDVYDQYRLVSASIVIKYIGRLDIVSGVIGGAIIFDENPVLNGTVYFKTGDGTAEVGNLVQSYAELDTSRYAKYGNFDLAMDSFYHQENLCLEGLRQLYFPIDNSYEEYSKLISNSCVEQVYDNHDEEHMKYTIELDSDNFKSGFNFFIYTLGAPSSSCLKLDIYCNYECLPNASFLNYMPTSVSTYGMNSKEKKETLDIVQSKPIMKANEIVEVKTPANIGWKNYMKDMAKKFKNSLPSMGKLANSIAYVVPKLKPAISIVSSMIGSLSSSAQTPQPMQEDK